MAGREDDVSLLSARSNVVDEVDEEPVVELPAGNVQLPAGPVGEAQDLPDGDASDEVENLLGGRVKRQGLAFKMMTALSCGGLILGMLCIQLMLVWAFGMQTSSFLTSQAPGDSGGPTEGSTWLNNNFYINFGYTEVSMVFRSHDSYHPSPCSIPPSCVLAQNVSDSYCSASCTWTQFLKAQEDWDSFLEKFNPSSIDYPPKAHITRVCEGMRQANVWPYTLVWLGFVSLCMVGLFITAAIFFDERLSFGVIICAFISSLCFTMSVHMYKNIFTTDYCGEGKTIASELLTPLLAHDLNDLSEQMGLEFSWGRCPWIIQVLGVFSSLFGCLLWTGSHSYLKNERDRLAYREVFS